MRRISPGRNEFPAGNRNQERNFQAISIRQGKYAGISGMTGVQPVLQER